MVVTTRAREVVDFNNFKRGETLFFDHYALAEYAMQAIQGAPGDVVELGCNIGESAKILQRSIEHSSDPRRKLYVYDSFMGLPKPDPTMGDGFVEGTLKVQRGSLIENFEFNNIRLPIIVEGWFKDAKMVPEQVAFAFFDGDMYGSIKDSFELIWDRVSPGGIIAVHDYHSEVLAGVKMATDGFLKDKPYLVPFCHKDRDLGNDILIIKKG